VLKEATRDWPPTYGFISEAHIGAVRGNIYAEKLPPVCLTGEKEKHCKPDQAEVVGKNSFSALPATP